MALSTSCSFEPRAPSTASKPVLVCVNAACDWVFTIHTHISRPEASGSTVWISVHTSTLKPTVAANAISEAAEAQWAEFDLDAVHIESLGLHDASDPAIFAAARLDGANLALLTKDEDFVKLLERNGPPPQVVWMRCGNIANRELKDLLLQVWPRTAALLAAGEPLVEVRPHRNRVR